MFEQHAAATNEKYKKPFNASDKRRATVGLIKIVIALAKSLNYGVVATSWSTIGVSSYMHVNCTQVMKQFNIRLTPSEFFNFSDTASIAKGLKLFGKNGRMRDLEMWDLWDVVKNRCVEDVQPRDELALYRQRCAILTHKSVTERFDQTIADKQAAGVAAAAAAAEKIKQREAKQKEAEERVALKETRQKEAEEKKAAKEEEKKMQRQRCSN